VIGLQRSGENKVFAWCPGYDAGGPLGLVVVLDLAIITA